MSQLIKILSMVLIIYCSIRAEEVSKPYQVKSNFIDLEVYDGYESLLLSWFLSDSIIVSETKIFVKEFGEKEFDLAATLPKEHLKYLDLECSSGARYFYKIEVMDIYGKTYFSDFDTPPFGTCITGQYPLRFVKNILTVYDLVINHMNESLKVLYPYSEYGSILDLLNPKLKSNNKWIEVYPLEKLNDVESTILVIDDLINKNSLYEEILSRGQYYRNHFYLSPKEWEIEVHDILSKIKKDWKLLYDQYLEAKNIFALIAPIRIISSKPIEEGFSLEIYIFHPDQTYVQDIYVISNEEYITLSDYTNLDSNIIHIKIPSDWQYIDLMMNDVFIQHCPLVRDKSVVYTIQGDIIPMETNLEVGHIRVGRKKSSLWVNEITWSPLSRKLNCELAGNYDISSQFYIKYQNVNLWEVQLQPSFNIQYVDSSFTLNEEIDIPNFVSLVQSTDSSVNVMEYIYLDSLPFAISRMPDGESWHYSESHTLGQVNKSGNDNFQQGLVPDLFVLYQNYPNPFNGQTKISFDLLEDAIINLYITDAKGRIHSRLVEEEYKSSGLYNYIWSGEGRSTGIYFVTLVAQVNDMPSAIFSRKMIYLK